MNAIRKRARAQEPAADYGPRQRLDNGTAVLTYRADPDKPNAPAIRAARAYVAYEALHSQGLLSDPEREAADRIIVAAELVTGARLGDSGGIGGKAFWETGGIGPRAVQAAADLRAVLFVLGAGYADVVTKLVCSGKIDGVTQENVKTLPRAELERRIAPARKGLAAMARHWGME